MDLLIAYEGISDFQDGAVTRTAPSLARLLGHPKREGFQAHGRSEELLAVLQGNERPEDELVARPLGSRRRSHTLRFLIGRASIRQLKGAALDGSVNSPYADRTARLQCCKL